MSMVTFFSCFPLPEVKRAIMYQALYRKYRPKTFDDVVGQEHITETLKKQVETGRLSHAYLFIGTRGTGKTTCAKIPAKAVNCEHPVNGNPCNQCAACRGIDDGSILDVVEIDAASNNRVEDVRALRDEAVFSPANVNKRVYIIDEVHMLSNSAFNALLKILEEPPAHLMFILATTELHKVPATILSRCQRHSFKRIPVDTIAARPELCSTARTPGSAAGRGRIARPHGGRRHARRADAARPVLRQRCDHHRSGHLRHGPCRQPAHGGCCRALPMATPQKHSNNSAASGRTGKTPLPCLTS